MGSGMKSAIIKANKEGNEIIVEAAHWEFIPNWIKSMEEMKEQRKKGIPFLNAKSENLFLNDKGIPAMWANAAMNSRCLVIATHFYEWRHYNLKEQKNQLPILMSFTNLTMNSFTWPVFIITGLIKKQVRIWTHLQ